MWGFIFLAAAGVGAILLAYSMGRAYERLQRDLDEEFSRHPVYRVDVRWEPCPGCESWGEPTGCGFAGCVDGYRPEVVGDDAA